MFTFINSYILYLLIAAVIPVLIHLFNRQRSKRIVFSSIRFLKLLEKKRLKNIKLYQYLLIFIRTLFLLFLIISFARPTFTGKVDILGDTTPTTTIIIIDNGINMHSFDSMGNRFIRAREQLKNILNQLDPNDQKFILTSDEPQKLISDFNEIDNLKSTYSKGSWNDVFAKAKVLFNEYLTYNKELFIISDFQFNYNNFREYLSDFKNVRIYLIKIGNQPIHNIKIDTVVMRSHLLEKNKNINIEIVIQSLSQTKETEIDLDLFINDQRVAHKKIAIDPSKKAITDLNFQSKLSGTHSGYVEISDDDLLPDNRYYFNFNIPEKIEVLFIDNSPSFYLENALQAIHENTNVSIKKVTYESWAKYNLNQFHTIYLSNAVTLQPSLRNRIKTFLDQNGSIIISPGIQTIPTEFNNSFKKLNPEIKLLELKYSHNSNDYFTFKKLNFNHPLFTGLFRKSNPDITEPFFYRYFKIYPSGKGESIISFNNNDPFLFKYKLETGSIYLLTSYIDEQWTDMQYKGIFSPLLLRLFYLAGSTATQMNKPVKMGEENIVILNQIENKKEYFLESPNGEVNRIVPETEEHNLIFKLKHFYIPGQYLLFTEKPKFAIISANISSNSINLPFVDVYQLTKTIPYLKIFSENQNFYSDIYEARTGKELWKIFILFALLCLFIELFLVKKIEGKI
jgi:hypothetical protein